MRFKIEMSNKFKCKKCKRVLTAKDGMLSCCGITETVDHSVRANRQLGSDINRQINKHIPPPIVDYCDYDEDLDEFTVYGIPNT